MHRVHGQTLEHLEEEEAGKGQGDKQQGVFDRPVGLQVLVHRVDKADAKLAAVEGAAIVTADAVIQGLGEVGGKEAGLPARAEAGGADLAGYRQELADKARVRPVGTQLHQGFATQRGDRQLRGALQLEVEGKVQTLAIDAVQRRQGRMHTTAEQAIGTAGGKGQLAAIEAQLEVVLDAPDIADADAEEGRLEAVVGVILADAVLRRQLEVAADLVVAVVQARLVDATAALLSGDMAVEFEALREEIQAAAVLTLFEVALGGFFVGFPFAYGLAVRHHQQRTGQRLGGAGAARDVGQYAIAQRLPVADHAADQQQGNHQQHDQYANHAQLDRQIAVHRVSPCGWPGGR